MASFSIDAVRRALALWLWPPAKNSEQVITRLHQLTNDLSYEYPSVRAIAFWVLAPEGKTQEERDAVLVHEAESDSPELALRVSAAAEDTLIYQLCFADDWRDVDAHTPTLREIKALRARYEQMAKIAGFK